jgi:putative sugar O-methyltransferase
MTWAKGFNATMQHHPVIDPDLSPYRINHHKLKRDFDNVLVSVEDIRQHYAKWAPYSLTDHVIIAYYFRNILVPYINRQKALNFMEIGGGSGNLASILYREFSPRIFFMVDLPESIINAFAFLSRTFPNARIVLPDSSIEFINSFDEQNTVKDYEGAFVFLTPWQINHLPSDIVDLSINTHSFQEMTHGQISDYFNLIERVNRNESFFFCANRVEKIPTNSNSYTEVQAEPPNRFYEYPWQSKNIRLIDEISRLHRVCSADGTAIRLEKIVKSV